MDTEKNAFTSTHATGAALMLICLAIPAHLCAQSADSVIAGSSPKAGETVKAEIQPAPVDDKPSRYAGKDISPYTASRAAVFSMRNRETDPFGLNQDPNVKPVIRQIANNDPVKRVAALPPTPLSEIIGLIRVTTVMPSEKKFLVGVRSFSESESFPLIFRGKRMSMKVVKVSTRSILFQNLENGETASLETEILPPGMIAGGGRIQPPGVLTTLKDAPLELGSDTAPDANN